jgi:hypothetical protein
MRATVTVEMESRYGWSSYIKDIFCISSIVSGMMVLVYVICVIMMGYTIQYTEICYLVNRSWHTAVCAA